MAKLKVEVEWDKDENIEYDKGATGEIVFVLDETGSMGGYEKSVSEAYNDFVASQKSAIQGKDITFTLRLFSLLEDEDTIRDIYKQVPFDKVENFAEGDYNPRGWTPLWDAIGLTIDELKNRMNEDDKVVVAIMTDGLENSSEEYTRKDISRMIEECQTKDWKFIFLGANMNAAKVGASISVPTNATHTWCVNHEGIRGAATFASSHTQNYLEDEEE